MDNFKKNAIIYCKLVHDVALGVRSHSFWSASPLNSILNFDIFGLCALTYSTIYSYYMNGE